MLYHDGQFDDARLALSLARAASDRGAVLLNHAEAINFIREHDRVVGAEIRDTLSGAELTIRARVVVNATGVFVDELRRREDPASSPLVAVSQGIHLVLPRRFLPGDTALMVPKTDDGRVLFAVPWHDRVIVGTTDTPLFAASAEPRALPEECAFVLAHARRYLSEKPTAADVLSVFAGLRPLVRGKAGGSTASLSREHALVVGPGGVLTVTGGKWTTYREMAEQVVDLAARLGRLAPRACPTVDLPLPDLRLPDSTPSARLHPNLPSTEAEVLHAARTELAETVEDVLARRTRALFLDARAAAACAPRVATLLAEELGRDATWTETQTTRFRALAADYNFVS